MLIESLASRPLRRLAKSKTSHSARWLPWNFRHGSPSAGRQAWPCQLGRIRIELEVSVEGVPVLRPHRSKKMWFSKRMIMRPSRLNTRPPASIESTATTTSGSISSRSLRPPSKPPKRFHVSITTRCVHVARIGSKTCVAGGASGMSNRSLQR